MLNATNLSHADFRCLIEQTTVRGGCLMALASVYIDESGTHHQSPIMSIAGFVFKRRKAIDFSRRWSAILRAKRVPFFHMTDITHPQHSIYKSWTRDELVAFEKQLINLTAEYATYGFAVSVSEDDFASVYADGLAGWSREDVIGSAYTYLLKHAISKGAAWAEDTGFTGGISYFFESGHAHQAEANRLINVSMNPLDQKAQKRLPELDRWLKQGESKKHYVSHTFMDKKHAPPLQAADLLAWLWRNAVMKALASRPERKDLVALRKQVNIKTLHCDVSHLIAEKQVISNLIGFLRAGNT